MQAFWAKFGPPDSAWSVLVQNRMGAKYDNSVVAWQDSSAILLIQQYGGTLDHGMGMLMSSDERAQRQAEDSAAQKAKRDL